MPSPESPTQATKPSRIEFAVREKCGTPIDVSTLPGKGKRISLQRLDDNLAPMGDDIRLGTLQQDMVAGEAITYQPKEGTDAPKHLAGFVGAWRDGEGRTIVVTRSAAYILQWSGEAKKPLPEQGGVVTGDHRAQVQQAMGETVAQASPSSATQIGGRTTKAPAGSPAQSTRSPATPKAPESTPGITKPAATSENDDIFNQIVDEAIAEARGKK